MTITQDDFHERNHVTIEIWLNDGPVPWVPPEDTPGRRRVGGIMTNANKFVYREMVEAHMHLATARVLRSLEEMGVLK